MNNNPVVNRPHRTYIFTKEHNAAHRWISVGQKIEHTEIEERSHMCNMRLVNKQEYILSCAAQFYKEQEKEAENIMQMLPHDDNTFSILGDLCCEDTNEKFMINPHQIYQELSAFIVKIPNFFQWEAFDIDTSTTESIVTNTLNLCYKNIYHSNYISVAFVLRDAQTHNKQVVYHGAIVDKNFSMEQFKKDLLFKSSLLLNPLPVKGGHYDVWLDCSIIRMMIGKFIKLISGSNLVQKNTCLKMGDKVFHGVNLTDNPYGYTKHSVDHDGNHTKSQQLIKDGILCGQIISNKNAVKLGVSPTGNSFNFGESITNLEWENLHPVIENFTGIYIYSLLGVQFNAKNGNFSASFQGFYMENGIKMHSLMDGTIAINFKDLDKITLLNDIVYKGSFPSPSGVIKNQYIGGI